MNTIYSLKLCFLRPFPYCPDDGHPSFLSPKILNFKKNVENRVDHNQEEDDDVRKQKAIFNAMFNKFLLNSSSIKAKVRHMDGEGKLTSLYD